MSEQYEITTLQDVVLDADRPFIGLARVSSDVLEKLQRISWEGKGNKELTVHERISHASRLTAVNAELHRRMSPGCHAGCFCK